MRRRRDWHFLSLVFILLILGVYWIIDEHRALGVPFYPSEQKQVWQIEAKLSFRADGDKPIKARLYIPHRDEGFFALQENTVSRDYGVTMARGKLNRRVEWSIRHAKGEQSLYYRLMLYKSADHILSEKWDFESAKFVDSAGLTGAQKIAAEGLLKTVKGRSADPGSLTSETIKRFHDANDHNAQALLKQGADPEDIANWVVRILSLDHIHARVVHALKLAPANKASTTPLVATYNGATWQYYQLQDGAKALMDDMILWWDSAKPAYRVSGGSGAKLTFVVTQSNMSGLELAKMTGGKVKSVMMRFSLLSLPLQTQQVYQILVTVPIGVLVILLLRSFIGLTTLGTFMPVLIALAFRETQLSWGIGLFVMVTALGLAFRNYLDSLRLLVVPRLGVILTLVIIVMGLVSIVSHQLGLERGLSIALFPMVILTMTIERVSILWEERGPQEALTSAAGSLLAAVLAYLAMVNPVITYLLFIFPGFFLILIACMLLIGRYRGYRLSELVRFRAFARDA